MKEIRFVDLSGEKAFSFTDPPFVDLINPPSSASVPVLLCEGGGGIDFIIPPHHRVEGPVLMTARLWESSTGRGAFYAISEMARSCLNLSRPRPLFRGVLEWFNWSPPRLWLGRPTADAIPDEFRRDGMILQGGSQVANWWGKVISPAPDLARDVLRNFAAWWEQRGYEPRVSDHAKQQGSLVAFDLALVTTISDETRKAAEEFVSSFRSLYSSRFLNHYLLGWHKYVRRVLGAYYYQFVCVEGSSCLVISSDHLYDFLVLEKGSYLLTHPYPRRDRPGAD